MTELTAITPETIKGQIYTIRGKQVMLDKDLARWYGVETRDLNKAVTRNLSRFPEHFRFQLSQNEFRGLMFHFGTSNRGGTRKLPYAFTEQGVAMISALLRSEVAISISIQIMDAFVEMRKYLSTNADVFLRLENVERKQLKTDENFEKIFDALQSQDLKPKHGIFYDGQVFDAYVFIADLIRSAKASLVLIDNYVDDSVLSLFTKRSQSVSLAIYTKEINKQLALDLKKHNQQYDPVMIKTFRKAHDRFLILDSAEVYHIGASLKDLGTKWFAFTKLGIPAQDILSRL